MPKEIKNMDIILGSLKIKNMIRERIKELNLTYPKIIQESKDFGIIGLTKSAISLYLNNNVPVHGAMSQEHILFFCARYGIDVKLTIQKNEYNETVCIERTKGLFGV